MASPILMPSTDLRSLTVLEIAQRLQFVERDAGLVDGGLRVRDRGGAGFRHKVFHGLRGRAQVGCCGGVGMLGLSRYVRVCGEFWSRGMPRKIVAC